MIMLLFPDVWVLNGVLKPCERVTQHLLLDLEGRRRQRVYLQWTADKSEIMHKNKCKDIWERKQHRLVLLLDTDVLCGLVYVTRASSSGPEYDKWDACQESRRMFSSLSQTSVQSSRWFYLQHQQMFAAVRAGRCTPTPPRIHNAIRGDHLFIANCSTLSKLDRAN